jgi:hypothetical protein
MEYGPSLPETRALVKHEFELTRCSVPWSFVSANAAYAEVTFCGRGMELRLQTMPETVRLLEDSGTEVHILETTAAAELYNRLADDTPVGGLFHSTC